MVRARMARVAVAAALGLACGCSSLSGCPSCPGTSWGSRLTGLFHRNAVPAEVVGSPDGGPIISDPGAYEAPGCASPLPQASPLLQSEPPPLIPPPRPYTPNEAQRMPYQP